MRPCGGALLFVGESHGPFCCLEEGHEGKHSDGGGFEFGEEDGIASFYVNYKDTVQVASAIAKLRKAMVGALSPEKDA